MSRHPVRPVRRRGPVARAFTLVEMLIAMALTLILVIAIAEFYAFLGDTVKDGRAMIEASGQLRTAFQRLKADLDRLTVQVRPWADETASGGYFEYFEGPPVWPMTDADVNGNNINDTDPSESGTWPANGITTLLGDGDDVLQMTIRAMGEPLVGRFDGGVITSQYGEVAWWTGFDDLNTNNQLDLDEPRRIYRRQLLVLGGRTPNVAIQAGGDRIPDAATEYPFTEDGWILAKQALLAFWQNNDVSASIRQEVSAGGPVFRIRTNSMADLTRRERRFAHWGFRVEGGSLVAVTPTIPNPDRLAATELRAAQSVGNQTSMFDFILLGDARGEDVVLSNVLAFDVRGFDPQAVLRADAPTGGAVAATAALSPGDPGYYQAVFNDPVYPAVGLGAYVDLGYGNKLIQQLQDVGGLTAAVAQARVGNSYYSHFDGRGALLTNIGYTYDTWSLAYERGGPGFDGLDNNNANGVDDIAERITQPPYSRPLRGIEVKIRVYEPGTRQMRQATVGVDFLPE